MPLLIKFVQIIIITGVLVPISEPDVNFLSLQHRQILRVLVKLLYFFLNVDFRHTSPYLSI